MDSQKEIRSGVSRRAEELAGEALVDIRKLSVRVEHVLRYLRGTSALNGEERGRESDDESGWRLAA